MRGSAPRPATPSGSPTATPARVSVVEAATGRPIRTLTSGAGAHDIAISALAGKVYVMNELENRIAVFSASTLELLKTIAVPRPHHAKVSLDGRTVYVGLFNHNRIAAIDTATDAVRIVDSSRNVNARAHAPRPSTGNRFVFVPHEVGDEVTALDTATGEIVGSISPGSMPTEVLPASDGRRLFLAMRGEGRIKVVDLASVTITGSVVVGTQPESMMLANSDRTLIVSLRGTPAAMAFVDANALTLLGNRVARWRRNLRRSRRAVPRRPPGLRHVRCGRDRRWRSRRGRCADRSEDRDVDVSERRPAARDRGYSTVKVTVP